ncbi:MAG: dihydrodipicolinate synthase family protein, partial [Nocardioides sp.]
VVSHVVSSRLRELVDAWVAGDAKRATELHRGLLPIYTGMFRTQGVILTKASLRLLGLPGGSVRSPLVDASAEQVDQLRADLADGGLVLPE